MEEVIVFFISALIIWLFWNPVSKLFYKKQKIKTPYDEWYQDVLDNPKYRVKGKNEE